MRTVHIPITSTFQEKHAAKFLPNILSQFITAIENTRFELIYLRFI